MKAIVSAKGFTNVILVLNMKRFVRDADQARFERIRGREEFAHALRETWPQQLKTQDTFITLEEDKRRVGRPDKMSTEQVGFAIGVFRSLMLEKYTFPAYALDKEKVGFSDELTTNFQFKNLFWKQWNKWSIYVRPTNTGFFVIRLTHRYPNTARSFLKLAQDVVRLQESLDVRSAQNWLRDAREKYANDHNILKKKERSVQALLEWLGVDEHYAGDVWYYPVQWRIAMEVCSRFVKTIGSEIPVGGEDPIHLDVPKPSISIPLHDSYVVHHFIEVLATAQLVKRVQHKQASGNSQVLIEVNDVRESPQIRQALANLCEGAILKTGAIEENLETLTEQASSFPKHGWKIVDEILQGNQATWMDELCLMNSKAAILWPSKKWHEHKLLVSSVPGSTLQVVYRRYWDAIERMIEFVVEIRVMSHLIESASYDILVEISERIYQTQSKLFSGQVSMDEHLPELVARAASLRYQAALCRSLSHPQLWSRIDFATTKAEYLLGKMGVPRILEHVENNIDSITDFVNHIDDLYMADLSEKSIENDDKANWLSMVLAAASLTLTILILPSFWADINQVNSSPYNIFLPWIEAAGNWLAAFLIGSAIVLFVAAFVQRIRIRKY